MNFSFKAFCDDVTEAPVIPSYQGMRQSSSGVQTTNDKIHADKQEKLRGRTDRERFDDSSIGVVHQKPPGYNSRHVGKTPITHHSTFSEDLFKPSGTGTRRDDSWITNQGMHTHDKVYIGRGETIIMGEDDITGSNHQTLGGAGTSDCDVKCGSMEFFCSASCSCISSEFKCGKKIVDFFVDDREKNVILSRWTI